MTPNVAEEDRDKVLDRVMARHHNSGDALIEVLHAAQQLYGYLSPPLLKRIARALKLPPSRVLGVATFYHLFRFHPRKAHSAVVCSGTACYVAGSTELEGVLRAELGEAPPERRRQPGLAAPQWTIETGRCVGSCGLAPIVICDGAPLSRVTPDELSAHLKNIHDGEHSPSDPAN